MACDDRSVEGWAGAHEQVGGMLQVTGVPAPGLTDVHQHVRKHVLRAKEPINCSARLNIQDVSFVSQHAAAHCAHSCVASCNSAYRAGWRHAEACTRSGPWPGHTGRRLAAAALLHLPRPAQHPQLGERQCTAGSASRTGSSA